MVDIAHRVGIKAPASQVYQALATPKASPLGGPKTPTATATSAAR